MDRKKVSIMPMHVETECVEKLSYLKGLINNLYENEEYLLPVFLLRCQLVEFSLKYLLLNHPYPPNKFNKDKINGLTMGQMLDELKRFKDPYMEDIVKNLEQFKKDRNEFTHRFIDSKDNITTMKRCVISGMKSADEIEQNIWYFLDYADSFR